MVRQPYRFSAGIVVVRPVGGSWYFLLLRCFDYWEFPKGGVEPGETPLAAAIRETAEETGIDDIVFRWGEAYRETDPYGRPLKIARYYLGESAQQHIVLPISPTLGRPEHHEWRWVSGNGAAQLLGPRLQAILAWAQARMAA